MNRESDPIQIYVALLNDGVPVWRPVKARRTNNSVFQILRSQPESSEESWEFKPGEFVRCEEREFSEGDKALVAVEIASDVMSDEADHTVDIKVLMRSTRRMVEGTQHSIKRLDQGEIPFCNFCGKQQHEVDRLLAGAGAYICSACVALASEVISEGK